MSTTGPTFRQSVRQLSFPGVLADCRPIVPGDELSLWPEEDRSITSQIVTARRASGAARTLGRELLVSLGHEACAIPKAASGAPIWPAGIVGSFAHDDEFAVAAVARSSAIISVGIDIEPVEVLPSELVELVVTPQERSVIGDDPNGGRLLFAAKEAVYKAIAASDGILLDYHDIQVDLARRHAIIRNRYPIELRCCVSMHLVVLAFWSQARA